MHETQSGFTRRPQTLRLPPACVYEVTYACNCRCEFCYVASEADREAELDVIQVTASLVEQGIMQMGFSGGEPLLRPEVIDAALKARKANVQTHLITNGTLVEHYTPTDFVRAFRSVQVSLQGPTLQAHESVTATPGSFAQAARGIELLVSAGVQVNVNATLTQRLLPHLREMFYLVKALGAGAFSLTRFCVPFGGRHSEVLSVSPADLREALELCVSMSRSTGVHFAGLLSGVPLCILGPLPRRNPGVVRGCTCGHFWVDVTPDGYVKVCPPMTWTFGRYDALTTAWRSDHLRAWHDGGSLPPECGRCKLVSRCNGGCRASALHWTGDPCAPDPLKMRSLRSREDVGRSTDSNDTAGVLRAR